MVNLIMESNKVITLTVKIFTMFWGRWVYAVIRELHEGLFGSVNIPFFKLIWWYIGIHCVIKNIKHGEKE